MQQTCAHCSAPFEITDEDLAFYDKASPIFNGKKELIPPPTHCPDCRQQRRISFRNERAFHRRQCSKCQKSIIAVYPASVPFPVYCQQCWQDDTWDPVEYGMEVDLTQSFMKQFKALQDKVPRQYFVNVNSENSDYCNQVEGAKDCYLISGSAYNERCLYGVRFINSSDSVDCLWIKKCELCYECTDCMQCYNLQYAYDCMDVRDSSYMTRCQHCADCLFCVNLRQKKYCILNEELSKEDYEKRRAEILASESLMKDYMSKYDTLLLREPVPSLVSRMSENCSGNFIQESANVRHGYDVQKAHDCAYMYDVMDIKDSMDVYSFYGPGELCYEVYSAGAGAFRCMCIRDCWPCTEILYCDYCFGCESCFGCIALRQKKYCILNKQYTKEQYEELIPKIIEKMKADNEWGEYFPVADSPFPYNESCAQDFFPLTRAEIEKNGWQWLEKTEEPSHVDRTINGANLPTRIEDIPDDILNWAIVCEVSGKPFRITKQELEFYRRMHIPVPRQHPDERQKRRMMLRNPRTLWERACMNCQKGIQTTYSPDRPEIVYCEDCYLKLVY